MTNYEKRIEEMRKELNKAEAVVGIISKIEDNMNWDCMTRVEDESEKGYHFEAPQEDGWYYDKYVAYTEVLSVLEKHFFPTKK